MKNFSRMHRFVHLAIAALIMTVAATTTVSAQPAATYEIVSTGGALRLIQTRDGRFFGTSTSGVFAMAEDGSRTMVYRFPQISPPAFHLPGGLSEGTDGSLYGTTHTLSGVTPSSRGLIFKINPDDGVVTILHEGPTRLNGVTQARDGRLYVTQSADEDPFFALAGGVFRVEADGTLTRLPGHVNPPLFSELVEIDDGSLYGTGDGFTSLLPPMTVRDEIFQLIPNPVTGEVTGRVVHTFSGPDGRNPLSRLIQGADGLLYGTTFSGGLYGGGTVFSLDAAGTLTTLHHFAGPDGSGPLSGVIQGFDGRLYGTTNNGGAFGLGTVFVMNVTGGLTTLHDFTTGNASTLEFSPLMQASDGALYGAKAGVIFRIRLRTTPPPTNGYFEVVSRNSGKCLDISGGSTDAGAPAIQWSCHGGPNQQWRLEPAGGGAVRIVSRNSGHALDVSGASVDDLAAIIQWPITGGNNQAWTLEPASDGYVRLVVRHSGKAMDVEFGSTENGARVIQYAPHDGANQLWLLRPVASTALLRRQ